MAMRSGGVPPRGVLLLVGGPLALFGLSRSLSLPCLLARRALCPAPRHPHCEQVSEQAFFPRGYGTPYSFCFCFFGSHARTARDAAAPPAPRPRAPDRRSVAAFFGFRISASPVHREREPRPRQHPTGNANASDRARHAVAARRDAPRDPTGQDIKDTPARLTVTRGAR